MKLSYLIPTTEYLTKEEEKALFKEYHETPSLRRKKQIKEDLVLNQCGQIISIASRRSTTSRTLRTSTTSRTYFKKV